MNMWVIVRDDGWMSICEYTGGGNYGPEECFSPIEDIYSEAGNNEALNMYKTKDNALRQIAEMRELPSRYCCSKENTFRAVLLVDANEEIDKILLKE